MGGAEPGRWRAGITGVLLVVSLLTAGALALQAQQASTYHRSAAEQVLRDFARLAAGELVRRSTARLGYDGYMPLLTALPRQLGPAGPLPDARERLASDPDPRVRGAAGLVRRVFAVREGRARFAPAPESSELEPWLLERLRPPDPEAEAFVVVHGVLGGEPRSVVCSVRPGSGELIGFEVDLARLGEWIGRGLERGPLLPSSLGGGRVTNEALFLSVADHAGIERFRAGVERSPALSVEVPFGAQYSGVLEGARVRASIDPQAAEALVIGGLPRSRLPLLLGLLALSAALVATALLQLRRERALNRLRSEFVASVSHELRTPLTQIRMFTETLLLDRVRSAEERHRALEILDREARRLTHLVENVLRFSRAERGVAELLLERRALAPLVREVLEQFQPIVAAAGARVRDSLDEAVTAAVDADALRQILTNLLDNAVKYGPPAQQIVVGVERAGGAVRLFVEDEGPGIPPAERSRVFERFTRLARDRGSSVVGTGIGLAVVRELAERHGGRVHAEARAGTGTRLVLELPA